MAAATPAGDEPTRSERARRYVELNAIELMLVNILNELEPDTGFGGDDLVVGDEHRRCTTTELFAEFFPHPEAPETLEQLLLYVQEETLVAQLLTLLAEERMREFLLRESARFAAMSSRNTARARELIKQRPVGHVQAA